MLLEWEWERAALRSEVYPKLRELCRHTYGLNFQVLDAYEGVPSDDLYSTKRRQRRMELLQESLETSAGSYFVALIGEDYGEPCLPASIPSEEYERIVRAAETRRIRTRSLESRYMRDENGVPPVYSLLEEEGRQRENMEAFQEIQRLFGVVVPLCVQEQILTEDQARKYFSSALDDELQFILQNHNNGTLGRCICYIHKVPLKAYQNQRGQRAPTKPGYNDGYARLCHLRDTVLPPLATTHGLHISSSTTTCDIKVGYTREKRQRYIQILCRQVYEDMVTLIDSGIRRNRPPMKAGLEDILEHLSLCSMYSELRQYEFREEEEAIKSYLLRDGTSKPMVVIGEPGCGKTVLLASCAKKVSLWLSDLHPILVVRFVPSFGEPLNPKWLLLGLCQQLSDISMSPVPPHLDDIEKLKEWLHRLLLLIIKKRPLVLIIDSVDTLHCECYSDICWWLLSLPPTFTKIILSVSKENFLALNNSQISQNVIIIEMKPKRKEYINNLKISLLKQGRKITSGHQVYVNRSLTSCPYPLQTHLVYKEVVGWKSHQDVNDRSLGLNIHTSIERLFNKLEKKYGNKFVSKALSYITLSRSGIGEAELVDVLSADHEVIAELYDVNDVSTLRVPDWLVASILLDLRGCVGSRTVSGCRLLCWTNQFYQKVVSKRYLNNQEVIRNIHENMCDYFNGHRSQGKSTTITPNPQSETNRLYTDRQLPSQPWAFVGRNQTIRGNIKKALDLPYHLKECGRLDSLCDLVMSLPYCRTLLNSGHLTSMIVNIEDAATKTGRKDLKLISNVLQETRCLLIEDPNAFEVILQSKMVPLLPVYPSLFRFLGELIKASPLVVVNSGLLPLQEIKIDFKESSQIVTILDSNTKDRLIVVFKNGHIYTWTGGKKAHLEYKLSLPPDVEITGATLDSEDLYLGLSTSKPSMVLLNSCSWTFQNEIRDIVEAKNYHLSNKILFISFDKIQKIKMFDVLSGDLQKELVFAQEITYFGCIGQYLAVGQLKTLNLYSTQDGSQQIVLPMSNNRIVDVYLRQSFGIIIDKYGLISIWNVADPHTPSFSEELSNLEGGNEVVSTELCSEQLLVCRPGSFEVWQLTSGEKSSFRSLHEERFTCCRFSHDGDAVIGAVENIPSLFVWSLYTGQLVSRINLEFPVISLIKSVRLEVLGAVTEGNGIVLWDSKSITIPTAHSQTGRPFKCLTLCPLGGRAYTSDGSDLVCKWDIPRCMVSAFFQHRDTVEMIKVTQSGELLITSVSSAEVYVWEADSGINRYRIQSGPVSQILVTPNSHCVVTLCEDGGSRVWRAQTGCTVCRIRAPLSQAVITPESTFLIGLNDHRLLAISLWSGDICKEFRHSDKPIVAFQCLINQPHFVVFLTSDADLYTWNIVEETFCCQFRLPIRFSDPSTFHQLSDTSTLHQFSDPLTIHQHLDPSEFHQLSDSSTFHQRSGPSAFHQLSDLLTFHQRSGPSAFHQRSDPSTFHQDSDFSTFHQLSDPSTFNQISDPSTFHQLSDPSTFHQLSNPSKCHHLSDPSTFHHLSDSSTFPQLSGPSTFHQQSDPSTFQISSNGDFLLLSSERSINVISSLEKKCYTLHTPLTALRSRFMRDGKHIVYISPGQPSRCQCDFHTHPTLNVIEAHTGRKIATCHLGKMPCVMAVSEDGTLVCVGFDDGTLGLYSVAGKWKINAKLKEFLTFSRRNRTLTAERVDIHHGKPLPGIIWDECDRSQYGLLRGRNCVSSRMRWVSDWEDAG